MLKIPGVYVDFKGDLTELKRDYKKVRELSAQAGTDISNGMKNAVIPSVVVTSFDNLYQNLVKIGRVSSVVEKDIESLGITLNKDLLKNIDLTDQEFKKWQARILNTKAEQQAERAIKSLGKAAKLTAVEMAMLRRKAGDTKGAFTELARHASSRIGSLVSTVTGATLAIATMGYAIDRTSRMIWETGRATKVANNAFKEITGSTEAAAIEFEFLSDTADELGLNFYTLRDGYIGFLAAAKDSKLPMEEARKVFKSVSNAAAILGLSNDRVKYTFMALEQMMSKGKISMEELRRQMGDNLYGAFQKAAKAMGVTAEELDKMISNGELFADEFLPKFRKQLDKDFTGTIDDSVRATNKFSEAWTDLKNDMAESGFMESATTALKEWTGTLKDPATIEALKDMARLLGKILEISAKLSSAIVPNLRDAYTPLVEGAMLWNEGMLDVESWKEFVKKTHDEQKEIIEKSKEIRDIGYLHPITDEKPEEQKPKEIKKVLSEVEQFFVEEKVMKGLDSWFNELEKIENKLKEVSKNFEKINLTDKERRMQVDEDLVSGVKEILTKEEKARKDHNEAIAKDWKSAHEKMYEDTKRMSELSGLLVYDYQKRSIEASRETFRELKERYSEFTEAVSGSLYAAIKGDTEGIIAVWDTLMDSMLKKFTDTMAEMVTDAMWEKVAGVGKGVLGSFFGGGALSGLFGGVASNGGLMSKVPGYGMADGGIINEHVVGLGLSSGRSYEFGEGGSPEAVVPKKDWNVNRGSNNNNGGDTHIYIQANDAKSFNDMVRRNPSEILVTVGKAFKSNSNLRGIVRRTI